MSNLRAVLGMSLAVFVTNCSSTVEGSGHAVDGIQTHTESCEGASLGFTVDGDGSARTFDAVCGALSPEAYFIEHAAPGSNLGATACDTAQNSVFVRGKFSGQPGQMAEGQIIYERNVDSVWTNTQSVNVELLRIGKVGEVVEGRFSAPAILSGGSATLQLSGTFRVCRIPDLGDI